MIFPPSFPHFSRWKIVNFCLKRHKADFHFSSMLGFKPHHLFKNRIHLWQVRFVFNNLVYLQQQMECKYNSRNGSRHQKYGIIRSTFLSFNWIFVKIPICCPEATFWDRILGTKKDDFKSPILRHDSTNTQDFAILSWYKQTENDLNCMTSNNIKRP